MGGWRWKVWDDHWMFAWWSGCRHAPLAAARALLGHRTLRLRPACGLRALGLHAAAEGLAFGLLDPVFFPLTWVDRLMPPPFLSSLVTWSCDCGDPKEARLSRLAGRFWAQFLTVFILFASASWTRGYLEEERQRPLACELKGLVWEGRGWRGSWHGAQSWRGPPPGRSSGWRGRAGGKETVAPVLSRRAPARDRARLPFCGVAAISRRRGGRTTGEGRTRPAEVWGRGGGRARAPRPARTGERVPFVLGLGAGPRPAREVSWWSPGKAAERRAHSPALLCPPRPPKSGICPPHPGCVKGTHFVGEGSELHRGKLECHPEKEGALRSAAPVEVAQPFVSSALSHDGALHRSY